MKRSRATNAEYSNHHIFWGLFVQLNKIHFFFHPSLNYRIPSTGPIVAHDISYIQTYKLISELTIVEN